MSDRPANTLLEKMPRRLLAVAEPLSVAGLFVFLLCKTWMRWSDPLIDFPRDLYIAWRISEGDLLYQKIANWYGPLANLVQGAGFRVFGVGLDTMVWMNIALTVAVLLLLRAIFGSIGNRLSVWLVSVVFLVVFAFENFSDIANYNFITPYVAQSTYSLLGLLLVLWGLVRHLKTERPCWLGVAGAGLAVAYLDKPEALLAAAGAIGLYFLAQAVRVWRAGRPAAREWLSAAGWLTGGFMSLWLPVFVYFGVRGGWAFALGATDRVVTTMLDSSIRQTALNEYIMQFYMGLDRPWDNFLVELKGGASLLLVCGTIMLSAWIFGNWRKSSPVWWIAFFGAIGAGLLGGWLGMLNEGWQGIAPAFVLPIFGVTLAAAGWGLRAAWRGKEDFPRALGLAVVGLAASLMLARMILYPRLSHYGFFMMPLAVCFWIQVVVAEAARRIKSPVAGWTNCLLPAVFSALVLFAVGVLLRFELKHYSVKTYEIGAGRDRFYTFQPNFVGHGYLYAPTGVMLDTMIRAFKLKTPNAKTLAVFPEGIAVNYHLRVPSPLAEQEFNPAALGYAGTEHILKELQEHPPDVVCLFSRGYSEYNMKFFGSEAASGRSILLWLNEHYDIAVKAGETPTSATGHAVDLAVPKTEGDGLLPLLPPGK